MIFKCEVYVFTNHILNALQEYIPLNNCNSDSISPLLFDNLLYFEKDLEKSKNWTTNSRIHDDVWASWHACEDA